MSFVIDADEIIPGLWQGEKPRFGSYVRDAGFNLLVLCAEEFQPPAHKFTGIDVVHAPNQDQDYYPPSRVQLQGALDAATKVSEALQAKQKVLVTCWAGINRSGLVSALALHLFLGISGDDACALVKKGRPIALSNSQFRASLSKLRARNGSDVKTLIF